MITDDSNYFKWRLHRQSAAPCGTQTVSRSPLVRREISYYYWCKVEWEITIADYPSYISQAEYDRLNNEREKYNRDYGHYPHSVCVDLKGAKRIDVHDQIMLNWNAFVDYVWSYKQ